MPPSWPSRLARASARALAGLALFCQIVLGATVIDMAAAHARLQHAGLCRASPDRDNKAPPAHAADCALCPALAALHAQAPLPAPAALPRPTLRVVLAAPPPPARAPPASRPPHALARGPPPLA